MSEHSFETLAGRSVEASGPRYWFGVSLLAHAMVFALLLGHRGPVLAPTQLPGDRAGHQLLLTYLPGEGAATPVNAPITRPQATKNPLPPLPHTLPASPTPPAAPALARSSTGSAGSDSLGDGDIEIASLLVHPRPAPDLSQLPAGTRGDVIVDVVIGADGRIEKMTVQHGLGYGVEQSVLATVQQWTFQPATRNGVPVASEQELLFHYERG